MHTLPARSTERPRLDAAAHRHGVSVPRKTDRKASFWGQAVKVHLLGSKFISRWLVRFEGQALDVGGGQSLS